MGFLHFLYGEGYTLGEYIIYLGLTGFLLFLFALPVILIVAMILATRR